LSGLLVGDTLLSVDAVSDSELSLLSALRSRAESHCTIRVERQSVVIEARVPRISLDLVGLQLVPGHHGSVSVEKLSTGSVIVVRVASLLPSDSLPDHGLATDVLIDWRASALLLSESNRVNDWVLSLGSVLPTAVTHRAQSASSIWSRELGVLRTFLGHRRGDTNNGVRVTVVLDDSPPLHILNVVKRILLTLHNAHLLILRDVDGVGKRDPLSVARDWFGLSPSGSATVSVTSRIQVSDTVYVLATTQTQEFVLSEKDADALAARIHFQSANAVNSSPFNELISLLWSRKPE